MAETRTKIYSIESDENGKLWDLRTTMTYTVPLRLRTKAGNDLSQDVYKCNRFPFVYSLTSTTPAGESVEKFSTNDGLLQDDTGHFLFSKKLLKDYGIGFILASWLSLKDDKIVVKFKETYLKNWYSSPSSTEITDDEIYSWDAFINKPYDYEDVSVTDPVTGQTKTERRALYVFPDLRFDSTDTFVSDYGVSSEKCIVKKMAHYWGDCTYRNNCDTSKVTDVQWATVFQSRRCPQVPLQTINCDTNGNETGGIAGVYIESGVFVYPYICNYNSDYHYCFVRCDIPDNLDENWNKVSPVKLGILSEFIVNGDKTLVYNHSGEDISPYDTSTTLTDKNSLIVSTDNNGATDIDIVEKYTLVTTYMDDVNPYEAIPGINKYTYKNVKRNNGKTYQYSEVGKTYTADPPAETILDEMLNDPETKWQTPTEYYSSKGTTASQANIEDPFNAISESQSWFWVETIKNWCVYVERNNILYLMCWNGRDGWDLLEAIMNLKNTGYIQSLARLYLYSHLFFAEGPAVEWNICNPIRMPDGNINQYYYRTLYLTRDTISNNYNTKFQSLHDTKIYQTGERNEIANTGLGAKSTAAGTTIPVDSTRQAVFGVPTQYCPVLFKQTNGNIALSYTYYVVGNGYGVNTETHPYHIISPTVANERCRDIFGAGDDKTIDKDWKRYFTLDFTEERSSEIHSSNDDTIYGAASLTFNVAEKKINSITIAANRPNPGTNNKDRQDYIERWDK